MKTLKPSDRVAVLAAVGPDSRTGGFVTTPWVHIDQFASVMGLIVLGGLATGHTVNALFQQAQDTAGTGVKLVEGTVIEPLRETGDPDQDQQAVINLHASDLDLENGFEYIRIELTRSGAASIAGAVILGFDPRYMPASEHGAEGVQYVSPPD